MEDHGTVVMALPKAREQVVLFQSGLLLEELPTKAKVSSTLTRVGRVVNPEADAILDNGNSQRAETTHYPQDI